MTSAGQKSVLLSGMQPTNNLHLGNYVGALKNWVQLQKEYDCYFMAVDLHSITVRQDPKVLRSNTYFLMANYLAAGVDPHQCTLFIQSHVPQHAELGWVMNCMAYLGELNRMTQFKDKSTKAGKNIGAGLFTYPCLMAADILLYQSDLVPVGSDQKQHIELTRDLAMRMNSVYGEDLFKIPKPYIAEVGARIMDLQNPTSKMSKSEENPAGVIFMSDSDKEIEKKIKRAVTDSGSEIVFEDSKPGVANLLSLQAVFTGKSIPELVQSYAGKQYGHLKVETAEIVIQGLGPIRDRAQQILKDKAFLDQILKTGAEKARATASQTLKKVYDRLGFAP